MSIEPITRLQRFLRVLADSSADMPEPLRDLEKCCCYACGHLDTRPELHTTLEKLIASVRDKSIVPPKPNTRLEKYVAAMAGVWDDELPEPITREDKILFEAASGEDVTLSGNPLMLENCIGGKALKALHVYGKSTQDGTPSPDNPVPIVSVGDGGTVKVKITGKNLLYIPDGKRTVRGVTITAENGIISISGTATEDGYVYLSVKQISIHGLALLSSNVSGPTAKLVSESWEVLFVQNSANNTQGIITRICFVVKKGTNYDLNGINVQLELGSTATAYEPYHEQTLTLQTPNGLRGIPVASGGNYTDPTGQRWVCDEVDLARGIYKKRVAVTVLTVDMVQTLAPNTNDYCIAIKPPIDYKYTAGIRVVLMSNRFRFEKQIKNKGVIFGYSNQIRLYVDPNEIATLDAAKEFIEKNQIEVTYEVNEPIETPLTAEEIAAYKALTAHAPTTVLQATDGAGMEVTYKCNVRKAEKTINDLYAELTAELEA